MRGEMTRRGSVKRGSITWDEEEMLESKKLKAALEAQGELKKRQKEYTWDCVSSPSSTEAGDLKAGSSTMTKEQALKTLGLGQTQTGPGKVRRAKNVTDYSEHDILTAFQYECKSLSNHFSIITDYKS